MSHYFMWSVLETVLGSSLGYRSWRAFYIPPHLLISSQGDVMGFIASIFSKKALAIDTVKTQKTLYYKFKRSYPNLEPHELLQEVYLNFRRTIGDDVTREGVQVAAESETEMFACLPEPDNIKALALYMLYKMRHMNSLHSKYPNSSEEYRSLVEAILNLKENSPQEYDRKYALYNPNLAKDSTDDIEHVGALERVYNSARERHPNEEPHTLLYNTYLVRLEYMGFDKSDKNIIEKAQRETRLFAGLAEPHNVRALEIHLLQNTPALKQELRDYDDDFINKYTHMRKKLETIHRLNPKEFIRLYRLFNPELASLTFGKQEAKQEKADYNDLLKQATRIVNTTGKASTSLLQRQMSCSYGRAKVLIDRLEAEGIIRKKHLADNKTYGYEVINSDIV